MSVHEGRSVQVRLASDGGGEDLIADVYEGPGLGELASVPVVTWAKLQTVMREHDVPEDSCGVSEELGQILDRNSAASQRS